MLQADEKLPHCVLSAHTAVAAAAHSSDSAAASGVEAGTCCPDPADASILYNMGWFSTIQITLSTAAHGLGLLR